MENKQINDIRIFYLDDEIILAGSSKFDIQMEGNILKEDRKIILNFSRVNFINSETLGSILKLYKILKDRNGQIVLTGFNSDISKLFKITKIDNVITTFENETDAIKFLERK